MALRKKTFVWLLAVLALAGCAAPRHVQAQFLGYTSAQSTAQVAFTNQAVLGFTPAFTNLGQSSHILTYCNTAFGGTIVLEASPDATFAAPIPLASATYGQGVPTDTGCHVLQAGGYYQSVRARITLITAGSVSAWYTSAASPISVAPAALSSFGQTSPVACDKFLSTSIAPSTANGVLVSTFFGAAKVYVCQMTISFTAATTAGTITIEDGGAAACTTVSGATNWQLQVTANTPQTVTFGGPLGSFTGTALAGRCLMVATGAITANAVISLSYAQF